MLGCLPNPGGLFQQNPTHIKRISTIFEARQIWRDKEEKKPPPPDGT